MKTFVVLGVDPGGTTGVCIVTSNLELVDYDQLDVKDGFIWPTWFRKVVPHVDLVVAEKYTITPRTTRLTRQYDALDILGTLRYLSLTEATPLELQTPADAKNAFSDLTLRRHEQFNVVRGPHARDALRHALLGIRRHYKTV